MSRKLLGREVLRQRILQLYTQPPSLDKIRANFFKEYSDLTRDVILELHTQLTGTKALYYCSLIDYVDIRQLHALFYLLSLKYTPRDRIKLTLLIQAYSGPSYKANKDTIQKSSFQKLEEVAVGFLVNAATRTNRAIIDYMLGNLSGDQGDRLNFLHNVTHHIVNERVEVIRPSELLLTSQSPVYENNNDYCRVLISDMNTPVPYSYYQMIMQGYGFELIKIIDSFTDDDRNSMVVLQYEIMDGLKRTHGIPQFIASTDDLKESLRMLVTQLTEKPCWFQIQSNVSTLTYLPPYTVAAVNTVDYVSVLSRAFQGLYNLPPRCQMIPSSFQVLDINNEKDAPRKVGNITLPLLVDTDSDEETPSDIYEFYQQIMDEMAQVEDESPSKVKSQSKPKPRSKPQSPSKVKSRPKPKPRSKLKKEVVRERAETQPVLYQTFRTDSSEHVTTPVADDDIVGTCSKVDCGKNIYRYEKSYHLKCYEPHITLYHDACWHKAFESREPVCVNCPVKLRSWTLYLAGKVQAKHKYDIVAKEESVVAKEEFTPEQQPSRSKIKVEEDQPTRPSPDNPPGSKAAKQQARLEKFLLKKAAEERAQRGISQPAQLEADTRHLTQTAHILPRKEEKEHTPVRKKRERRPKVKREVTTLQGSVLNLGELVDAEDLLDDSSESSDIGEVDSLWD